MPRILRTIAARDDYRDIHEYVAADSPQNAAQLLLRFDMRVHALARNPLMGRSRPELAPRLRSFPESSYVIFYRPLEDGIELIRVIHRARDVSPDFFQDL